MGRRAENNHGTLRSKMMPSTSLPAINLSCIIKIEKGGVVT